jgi:hypothetical protein
MGLTRACSWLALSSWIAATPQTPTTTLRSAANAIFAYVSDDGCVQNEVVVFASRTTVMSADPQKATVLATYYRNRYNFCEDSDLGTELGTSSQSIFSGDLNRASLTGTISGPTASGPVAAASFVLVWQGNGDITRLADRPQQTRAGRAKVIRSEDLTRNAVASGTIDGRDVSSGVVGAILHTTEKTISR